LSRHVVSSSHSKPVPTQSSHRSDRSPKPARSRPLPPQDTTARGQVLDQFEAIFTLAETVTLGHFDRLPTGRPYDLAGFGRGIWRRCPPSPSF
jgi:hypothetical protein